MAEALRAELHDPLWLLAFGWLTHEFHGEDAGSPVQAELEIERDHVVGYDLDPTNRREESPGPKPAEDAPLDVLVEREPIVEGRTRADDPPLRVRAEAGQRFLRALDQRGYRDGDEPYSTRSFPEALRLSAPEEPLEAGDRRYATLMAGRTLDGHAVFEHLRRAVPDLSVEGADAEQWGTQAADPPLPAGGEVTASYREAAASFFDWYAGFYNEPERESGSAWRPEHMEYGFAISTGAGGRQAVFEAPEYPGRSMDWHSFSPGSAATGRPEREDRPVDGPAISEPRPSASSIDDAPASRRVGSDVGSVSLKDEVVPTEGRTMEPVEAAFLEATDEFEPTATTSVFRTSVLPAQTSFPGMPASRWWEFEDSAVTLSDVAGDGATVPRLLVLDFAVQFGTDWFDVPVPTPVGSYSRVTELTIHDSFGITETAVPVQEQTDEWNMFMFGGDGETGVGIQHDRPGLLLVPTTSRSNESDPVEEVLLTRDELANLAFGIERRVEGAVGTPVDRGTFQVPGLDLDAVVAAENPDDEYVRFRNDGEDDLDVGGWVVLRETDGDAEPVYEFEDVSISPETTVLLYTGTPTDPPAEPGVRVETCERETSLWADADVLSVTAPGEDDERRLVLRRPFGSVDAEVSYRIASDVPNHWFPFTMEVEDGQPTFDLGSNEYVLQLAVLLDASTLGVDPAHLPTPQGHILNPDPTELRDVDQPEHPSTSRFSPLRVFESEAPRSGRRITRQYRHARWVDGDAYLWSSRAVGAGEAEAVSGLRFDFLETQQSNRLVENPPDEPEPGE